MPLRIHEVLKEKGVSVIQLAQMLNVTRSACYQYINGNPTAERLESIARVLHVKVGELFDDSLT
jgi:transcriptional regulator with XRE-family HTH domain